MAVKGNCRFSCVYDKSRNWETSG